MLDLSIFPVWAAREMLVELLTPPPCDETTFAQELLEQSATAVSSRRNSRAEKRQAFSL
jgi:hypothetical protein